MEWKNIYRGMLMGASDVVPGVSGGTIAVVLGIYDRLIKAINGFFSKDWKKHLSFLLPLGVGVVIAILVLADIIEWLFKYYPGPTQFAFLGLIVGVLPYLFHKSEAKQTFKGRHILLLFIGINLVLPMQFFGAGESEVVTQITTSTYLWLFVAGFVASSAMILPGISGSFLLLILGAYTTILNAVSELKFDILIVVVLGIAVGLITMSKIIHFFLQNYTTGTFAVVIGLVMGSVFVIFPGWPTGLSSMMLSLVTFLIGLLVAYLLGRVEYKE